MVLIIVIIIIIIIIITIIIIIIFQVLTRDSMTVTVDAVVYAKIHNVRQGALSGVRLSHLFW